MKVLYNGENLIELKSFQQGILEISFQDLLLKVSFGSRGEIQSEITEKQSKLLRQYYTIN